MARTRRTVLAGLAGVSGAGCVEAPRRVDPLDAGTADVRLGLAGDAMLGRGVNDRWTGADPAGVWGSALGRLRALDGLLLNLECCVSTGGERWPDKVYYFRAEPSVAVPALEAAGTATVSLANNHVLDFGEQGLRDTGTHLDNAGIAHAGAGPDRAAALAPAVAEIGGLQVATVAFTDRFPAYAAGDGPGTAYAHLDRSVPATRALVERALDRALAHDPDLLIASLHWGPNWVTAPDATQQDFARWLIDRGVDAVHGHSAHVLQGVERYRGRPIVYDAGDVVDDYIDKDGLGNKHSALFELAVADGALDTLRIVPIGIDAEQTSLARGDAAAWVRDALRERSAPFDTAFERAGESLVVSLGQ